MCEPLPDVAYGSITYTYKSTEDMTPNYEIGTIAAYTCAYGFYLEGGEERNCTAGNGTSGIGVFDGEAPTCVRK